MGYDCVQSPDNVKHCIAICIIPLVSSDHQKIENQLLDVEVWKEYRKSFNRNVPNVFNKNTLHAVDQFIGSISSDWPLYSIRWKKKVKEKHRNEKECCVNLEKVFQNGGTPIYISCPAFCWTDFFVQNIDEISFFLEIWEEMIGCNIKIMIIF